MNSKGSLTKNQDCKRKRERKREQTVNRCDNNDYRTYPVNEWRFLMNFLSVHFGDSIGDGIDSKKRKYRGKSKE